MEKWEYQTRFFEARAKGRDVKSFIKEEFDKRPKRYSPEAMIPELNELGEEGWEIIHMEPVARVGGKEDVLFDDGYRWSNTYFCVLKRRKPGSYVPVMPLDAQGKPAFPQSQPAQQPVQPAQTQTPAQQQPVQPAAPPAPENTDT